MDPIFSRFPLLYCCFDEQKPFVFEAPFPMIENKSAFIILGPVCQAIIDYLKENVQELHRKKLFWFSNCGQREIGEKNVEFFENPNLILWDLIDPSSLSFITAENIQTLDFQVLNFSSPVPEIWIEHLKKSVPILFYARHEKEGKQKILKNIFSNLKLKKNFLDYQKAQGLFNQKPLLIVGAGPSFDQYKEEIQQLSSFVHIMGIGTGLKLLEEMSITPDFGCVVDPNIETYDRLKDISLCKVIFSSLRTHFQFYEKVKSGVCLLPMFSHIGLDQLKNQFAKCPILELIPMEGCTTATLGFQVAKHLGFSKLIFVGCDLCYGQKAYAGSIDSEWPSERFKPEIYAMQEMAKNSFIDLYRVMPGEIIQGFKLIQNSLYEVLEKKDLKEDVLAFFEPLELDLLSYHECFEKSLSVCKQEWEHPLKEVVLEDELAFKDLLKDFEISPDEFEMIIKSAFSV